jgi:hypothetical protein
MLIHKKSHQDFFDLILDSNMRGQEGYDIGPTWQTFQKLANKKAINKTQNSDQDFCLKNH